MSSLQKSFSDKRKKSSENIEDFSRLQKIFTQKIWQHECISIDLLSRLTAKELDVTYRVYLGLQDKEIADALHISIGSVRARLARIERETGCQSRVEIALLIERVVRTRMSEDIAEMLSRRIRESVRKSIR